MEHINENGYSTFRKNSSPTIERMFEAMPGDIILMPKPKPKTSN